MQKFVLQFCLTTVLQFPFKKIYSTGVFNSKAYNANIHKPILQNRFS